MGYYLENGYIDFYNIKKKGLPFNILLGGRGIGKTYGALKWEIDNNSKFIYMRRSQTQLDSIANDAYSPFTPININDDHINPYIGFSKETRNGYGIYDIHIEDDKKVLGERRGGAIALSTFSNIRGFDASGIEDIIYDEFIPEAHEKEVKEEAMSLLNAYETVNRNRELAGRSPVQLFLMGNSNNLGNDILVQLRLIEPISRMIEKQRMEHIDSERGIGIWVFPNSPISKQKRKTALYKLAPDDFSTMALNNIFLNMYASEVKQQNLKEYRPIARIGDIVLYEHKSEYKWYFSTHYSGSPREYETNESGWIKFKYDFKELLYYSLKDLVYYETRLLKILLTKRGIVV